MWLVRGGGEGSQAPWKFACEMNTDWSYDQNTNQLIRELLNLSISTLNERGHSVQLESGLSSIRVLLYRVVKSSSPSPSRNHERT